MLNNFIKYYMYSTTFSLRGCATTSVIMLIINKNIENDNKKQIIKNLEAYLLLNKKNI